MFLHYLTAKNTIKRWELVQDDCKDFDSIIQIDMQKQFQTIIGFGGAFTESTAYVLNQMTTSDRKRVIDHYFNKTTGLNYTIGRVHINSCDFSLENYTYVSPNDLTLESFDIAREEKLVIPLIKDAEKVTGHTISLLASPWSPPAWMKSNGDMNHGGKLLDECKEVWAKYYVKFIEAYEKAGLKVDYITVQNEPAANQVWDSCLYTAEEERDFVKDYLGPILHESHPDVKIIIWDHNRDILAERGDTVLKDKKANEHVWGTGVHWYVSEAFENLGKLHDLYPDKHLLFTEGCIEGGVHLNQWYTGERYARNMIGDFRNHCEGYLDWNLTLNEFGGPNHVGNYCDAPIICDTTNQEVILNSSFYYIGHFSKFIIPGSKRIASHSDEEQLKNVAFITPENKIVIIILNETETDHQTKLILNYMETVVSIPRRSISTLIYER